jgi:TPR repeat protein
MRSLMDPSFGKIMLPMCHPCRGLSSFLARFPPFPRWATLLRPFGTSETARSIPCRFPSWLAATKLISRVSLIAFVGAMLFQPASLALAQSSAEASAKKEAIANLKEIAYAGNSNAQVQLGLIYLTGDGVTKDDAEALKWLRKAADQDNAVGERYLAEMYFKGRGIPADNSEAAKWLRAAAEQGDAESEHNLAVLYTQGQGVPRNLKEASDWMRKAADQGLAEAQLGLGALYENGDGVPENPAEAVKWYRLAVAQNNAEAMSDLARLLATSKDSHIRNPQEAVALATKAVAAASLPDYLDSLAAAYFAAGQNDKAVETEQKAMARDPQNEDYQRALQTYLGAAKGDH